MTRRAIIIEGTDVVLELSKVVMIRNTLQMINLDQLKDGTWRLIYSEGTIPDITQVEGFKIIRED